MTDVKLNERENNLLFDKSIIEICTSLLFFLTTFAICTYADVYVPNYEVPYWIMMSGAIPVVLSALVRQLNIPSFFKVIASFAFFVIYSVVFYPYFNVTIHLFVLVILDILNIVYAMLCIAKPISGRIKINGVLFAVLTNFLVKFALTYLMYDDREIDTTGLVINVFLAFFIYFVARQINEFEVGYYHSMRSSVLPVKEVSKQNRKTIVVVTIGFAVAIFCLWMLPWKFITNWLTYLIRLVMSKLLKQDDVITDDLDLNLMETGEEMIVEEEAVSNPWVYRFIWGTFGISIAAIFTILIVRAIMNEFGDKNNYRRQVVGSSDAVTDVIERVDRKPFLRRSANVFGTGYEMKIRKKFYKKVRKAISHGAEIKSSYTAKEITSAVDNLGKEQLGDLTKEYEKVRYK